MLQVHQSPKLQRLGGRAHRLVQSENHQHNQQGERQRSCPSHMGADKGGCAGRRGWWWRRQGLDHAGVGPGPAQAATLAVLTPRMPKAELFLFLHRVISITLSVAKLAEQAGIGLE